MWLTDKCFDDVCTLDNGVAIKSMATGNETISFVECTRMQSGSTDSYQAAEYKPDHPRFDKPPFECLIDVQAARRLGTRPIASRYVVNGHFKIDVPERNEAEMTDAPIQKNIANSMTVKQAIRQAACRCERNGRQLKLSYAIFQFNTL